MEIETIGIIQISLGCLTLTGSVLFFLTVRRLLVTMAEAGSDTTRESQRTAEVFQGNLAETRQEIQTLRGNLEQFRDREFPETARQVDTSLQLIEEWSPVLNDASRALEELRDLANSRVLRVVEAAKQAATTFSGLSEQSRKISRHIDEEVPVLRENVDNAFRQADVSLGQALNLMSMVGKETLPAAQATLEQSARTLEKMSSQLPAVARQASWWLLAVSASLSIGLILSGIVMIRADREIEEAGGGKNPGAVMERSPTG